VSVALLEVVVRSPRDDSAGLPVFRTSGDRLPAGRPQVLPAAPEPTPEVLEVPDQGPSDAALVAQMSERRLDALDTLYRKYGKACYRLARRVVVDAGLAEDCVQEAFLGLWRDPERFDAKQGSLSSWLLSVTHHKAVDLVRRETAQQRRAVAATHAHAFDAPAGDPESEAWLAVRRQSVRKALGELPEPQREVLALAYFGGYTQREIAEIVGAPLGTVKTRTLAAMRRLRETLGPLAGPEEA
jgi:RNA polymerase sigma factor (sigma-70 family)